MKRPQDMNVGAARNSDPVTSHQAAASVDATALEEQVGIVVRARAQYGATSYEVQSILGLSHQSVSPRFAPLKRKGVIRDSGRKRPGGAGRSQIVWVAA